MFDKWMHLKWYDKYSIDDLLLFNEGIENLKIFLIRKNPPVL